MVAHTKIPTYYLYQELTQSLITKGIEPSGSSPYPLLVSEPSCVTDRPIVDFDLEFIEGSQNSIPDFLTREFLQSHSQDVQETIPAPAP